LKLIECTRGYAQTSLGGTEYTFERDQFGRFVSEVINLTHRSLLLSVVHYREVDRIVEVPADLSALEFDAEDDHLGDEDDEATALAREAEAERIAAEQAAAEAERVAAEEAEKKAAEEEAARLAAEKAETDRIAAEKAEADRIAAEKAAAEEAARLAAEQDKGDEAPKTGRKGK
jgi:hypothetical protein